MGVLDNIFGDDNTEAPKDEEFLGVIVKCDNVTEELKSISAKKDVALGDLDFDILDYRTFVKLDSASALEEWGSEKLQELDKEGILLNRDLEIRQRYEIRVKKFDKNEFKINIQLSGNKSLSRVIATIKKEPRLRYSSDLQKNIYEEINKKKLRAGLLIGLWEGELIKNIERVVAKIRVNGSLNEDVELTICKCLEPLPTVNDKLIHHYKTKNQQNVVDTKTDRVDYSQRGFITGVKKGDLILEYIKPKHGLSGRNCKGVFLEALEPKKENEITFKISEKISVEDKESRTLYYAQENGYVLFEDDKLDISEELEVNEISFKSTGSVNAGSGSDVKINITEKDALRDAIGPSVKVEAAEVIVSGNVSGGAEVKAQRVKIGGQTHQQCKIIASESAIINLHKGYVKAKEVHVSKLENGIIEADVARVVFAMGGVIKAREIYIDTLNSYTQLTASKIIEIQKAKGQDNKIVIDALSVESVQLELDKLRKLISDLEDDIRKIDREIDVKTEIILKNRRPVESVKQNILALKEKGLKIPVGLIDRVRQFQKIIEESNSLKSDLEAKEKKKEDLIYEVDKIQNGVFNAKVVSKEGWREHNEIRFKLINPPIDVPYIPKPHDVVVMLKEAGDGEFFIDASGR